MSLQHKNENMVELFFCNWWYFVGLQDLCVKKKKKMGTNLGNNLTFNLAIRPKCIWIEIYSINDPPHFDVKLVAYYQGKLSDKCLQTNLLTTTDQQKTLKFCPSTIEKKQLVYVPVQR